MYLLEILNLKSSILFIFIILINFLVLNFRNKIATILNINDIPNSRKIHTTPTPLIGGICFFISILILLFFNFLENQLILNKFIIYLSIFSIFFFTGLFDDIKPLSPIIRTVIIILSISIFLPYQNDLLLSDLRFISTSRIIDLNKFSLIFTLFCIFALYNAFNFIDGVNGSATSIIIFWTLFLLIKNPNLIYLILIFVSILIFLYNVSGKIFLGNSGTSLLSIYFSLLIINDYNTNYILYADEIFFLLLFPGIDMTRVIFERILNKKKIYTPDKIHFHHYLIQNKFTFIWQSMLGLTILPLFIFYLLKNIVISTIIFIVIYLIFLIFLKNNDVR